MHPEVMDVAVFGIPNEEFGEEVKGVVQLRDITKAGPEKDTNPLSPSKWLSPDKII